MRSLFRKVYFNSKNLIRGIIKGEFVFRFLFGCVTVLMVSVFLPCGVNAETVILQSGQKIKGKIIERTELRITVDVKGVPQTLFLGEIASIDGKKVEPFQDKNAVKPPTKIKKPDTHPLPNSSRRTGAPEYQQAAQVAAAILSMRDMMGQVAKMSWNVVPTSDGGIIIVTTKRIIKYDKDLNIVKVVADKY